MFCATKKSGAHISLIENDDNKVFYIAFRITPPMDSRCATYYRTYGAFLWIG